MEPKIRAYINKLYNTYFEPNRLIIGDLRFHTDGFNEVAVLEIKTTSQIYENVNDYKIYLVQLLSYMKANKVTKGILAVYKRPDDLDETFEEDRLFDYEIDINDYQNFIEEIDFEIDKFREDLKRLKNNPLLSEEDFQPQEVIEISNKVLALEKQLAEYKNLEQQYKELKNQLYNAMLEHNIKSWRMVNGTRITKVDEIEATEKTVSAFNEKKFAKDNPALYLQYLEETKKKKAKRAGYVIIKTDT